MMSVSLYPIFKFTIFLCVMVMLGVGVYGLVKQKMNKKSSIFLIILSLFVVYSAFFSCYIPRPAMFKEDSLNSIVDAIRGIEEKQGSEYFCSPIYYNNCNYASVGETCSIHLIKELAHDDYIRDFSCGSFLSKIFSREYDTQYGSFWCSAVRSDGGFSEYHTGYNGLIVYKDLNDNIYYIEYSISRNVDILIGPLWAFPYYGECDIIELIQNTQGQHSLESFLD